MTLSLARRRRIAWTRGVLLAAGLTLAACAKEPTGQVVAVLGDEEITLQELNAELGGSGAEGATGAPAARQAALQRVIDRKLLAAAARRDELDQRPEYIIRERQVEDALLVQMLGKGMARSAQTPTAAEINRFIAANPTTFANRSILLVDQIAFEPPTRQDYLQQLARTKTMAEVVATLDRLGIRYQRRNGEIDTAALPPTAAEQIRRVPSGEPFVLPGPAMVTVNLLTGERPSPLTGEAARPAAVAALRNQALGKALQQRLDAERAQSEIKYQPGYAPAAAKGGATKTAT